MMYPILCKVRYETLPTMLAHPDFWKQLFFSFILNWIVAPFLMVSLEGTRGKVGSLGIILTGCVPPF